RPLVTRLFRRRRAREAPLLNLLLRHARGEEAGRAVDGGAVAGRLLDSVRALPKHVPRIPIEGFPAGAPASRRVPVRAGPRPRPSCRAASAPRATCAGRGPR